MQSYNSFEQNLINSQFLSQQRPINSDRLRFPPPVFPPPNQPPFNPPPRNTSPNVNSGNQAPLSAPPQTIPSRNMNLRSIDSGSIRNCMYKFTYVWLDNGVEFWMYPIQLGKRSVSGFRWNRNFGWVYFGISLERIDAFTCV